MFLAANRDNEDWIIISEAVYTDLYDKLDVTLFERIELSLN